MASKFSLILCIIFGICALDFTNGASSSPSGECSKLVLAMTDCFSFLTNGSTLTQPEGSCCNGLKTIVNTAPSCLCGAFKGNAHLGVVLNVSKALTLPFACKVSAPSISNCGLPNASAAAPGVSISPWPASSPTTSAEAPAAAPPSGKSAASTLLPISVGSLLVCLLSLFSGL
ncbi:non-specific lipid transfer protein GPI-anchored 11 [Medicago truncatula]|uniref:Lipid transfer protein n=2 Tax=Medicago truncatula TaxID=3880 RepID=G7INT4_MEDTR|nr:non-specific lipid transfer protein GPI-anchored 11 [Medicago truncatula]AES63423.1 Lipid transfer protein [Medicago truncatula]